MDVLLYNTSDPKNKIDKRLGNSTTIENVRFVEKDVLNVINPSILLKLSDEISDISHYNYLKIPKFDRYYYITNISAEGGLIKIDTKVDPLKSFASEIKASQQYVTRSSSKMNRYLVDNMLPIHSDHKYIIKNFGVDVYKPDCHYVILETIGKGGTPS